MNVKELIALLQKQDPELDVVCGGEGNECYFYDVGSISAGHVEEGIEAENKEANCVLIRAN